MVGEGAAPSRHANLASSGVYKTPPHGWCYPPFCRVVLSGQSPRLKDTLPLGTIQISEPSHGYPQFQKFSLRLLFSRTLPPCDLHSSQTLSPSGVYGWFRGIACFQGCEVGYWQFQHQGQFPFQPSIERFSDDSFSHFGERLSRFD